MQPLDMAHLQGGSRAVVGSHRGSQLGEDMPGEDILSAGNRLSVTLQTPDTSRVAAGRNRPAAAGFSHAVPRFGPKRTCRWGVARLWWIASWGRIASRRGITGGTRGCVARGTRGRITLRWWVCARLWRIAGWWGVACWRRVATGVARSALRAAGAPCVDAHGHPNPDATNVQPTTTCIACMVQHITAMLMKMRDGSPALEFWRLLIRWTRHQRTIMFVAWCCSREVSARHDNAYARSALQLMQASAVVQKQKTLQSVMCPLTTTTVSYSRQVHETTTVEQLRCASTARSGASCCFSHCREA